MACVNVKVKIGDNSKVLRLALDQTVHQAIGEIQHKLGEAAGDHGIYQPPARGKKARWFKNNRVLKYYNILPGSELEYKKRHRVLRIKLADDSHRSVLIDQSSTIREIIDAIAAKLQLKEPDQYGLRKLNAPESEWLDQAKLLCEEDVTEDETLSFSKKLFFSDFTVDKDDPVQLHLIYVQSSNAVTSGKYDPLERHEVIDLAGMQAQILYGNYDPTRMSKSGVLDMTKLVPPAYQRDKRLEKDIIKEWSKLTGVSDINGQYRFVQIVRSLKTYGISMFEGLERVKGRKKPQRILLGMTKDRIMKIDVETHETVKEWGIEQLRRWAATSSSITLDFGDYEEDYLVIQTSEGNQISRIISDYIDIILKSQGEIRPIEHEEEGREAYVGSVAVPAGTAFTSIVPSMMPSIVHGAPSVQSAGSVSRAGPAMMMQTTPFMAQAMSIRDVSNVVESVTILSEELSATFSSVNGPKALEEAQAAPSAGSTLRPRLLASSVSYLSAAEKISSYLKESSNNINSVTLDQLAVQAQAQIIEVATLARSVAVAEGDEALLVSARFMTDVLNTTLSSVKDTDGTTSEAVEAVCQYSSQAFDAAQIIARAVDNRLAVDQGSQQFLIECVNSLSNRVNELLSASESVASETYNPQRAEQLRKLCAEAREATKWDFLTLRPLIFVSSCPRAREAIQARITNLMQRCDGLKQVIMDSSSISDASRESVQWSTARASHAVSILSVALGLAEARLSSSADFDVTRYDAHMTESLTSIRTLLVSNSDPRALVAPTKALVSSHNELMQFVRTLSPDIKDKDRWLLVAKTMSQSNQNLMEAVRALHRDPQDEDARNSILQTSVQLRGLAAELTQELLPMILHNSLHYASKILLAKLVSLKVRSEDAVLSVSDPDAVERLSSATGELCNHLDQLFPLVVQSAQSQTNPEFESQLSYHLQTSIPQIYQLTTGVRKEIPNLSEPAHRQALLISCDELIAALTRLDQACRMSGRVGNAEARMADPVNRALESAHLELSGLNFSPPVDASAAGSGVAAVDEPTLHTVLTVAIDELRDRFRIAWTEPSEKHFQLAAASVESVTSSILSLARAIQDTEVRKQLATSARAVFATVETQTHKYLSAQSAAEMGKESGEETSSMTLQEDPMIALSAALKTLVQSSRGSWTRYLDEALAKVAAALKMLTSSSNIASGSPRPGGGVREGESDSSFGIHVMALRNATSNAVALSQAFLNQLLSHAPSVKSTARLLADTLQALASHAVTASVEVDDPTTAPRLLRESAALIHAERQMLKLARPIAVTSPDDMLPFDAVDAITAACRSVVRASETLVSHLGLPLQQSDSAAKNISELLLQLESGSQDALHVPLDVLLHDFALCSDSLQAASQRMVVASGISSTRLGSYFQEATHIASKLISSLQAVSYFGDPLNVKADQLSRLCADLRSQASQVASGSSKDIRGIATSSTQILLVAKEIASIIRDPAHRSLQQKVLRSAKNLVVSATSAIKLSRLNDKDRLKKEVASINTCVAELDQLVSNDVAPLDLAPMISPNILKELRSSVKEALSAETVAIRAVATAATSHSVRHTEALAESMEHLKTTLTNVNRRVAELNPAAHAYDDFERSLQDAGAVVNALSMACANNAASSIPKVDALISGLDPSRDALASATKRISDDIIALTQGALRPGIGTLSSRINTINGLVTSIPDFTSALVSLVQSDASSLSRYSQLSRRAQAALNGMISIVRVARSNEDFASIEQHREAVVSALSDMLSQVQTAGAAHTDLRQAAAKIEASINSLLSGSPPVTRRRTSEVGDQEAEPAPPEKYDQLAELIESQLSGELTTQLQQLSLASSQGLGSVSLNSNRIGETLASTCECVARALPLIADNSARENLKQGVLSLSRSVLSSIERTALILSGSSDASSGHASVSSAAVPLAAVATESELNTIFEAIGTTIQMLHVGSPAQMETDKAISAINQRLAAIGNASAMELVNGPKGQLNDQATYEKVSSILDTEAPQVVGMVASSARCGQLAPALVTFVKVIDPLLDNAAQIAHQLGAQSPAQLALLGSIKLLGLRAHQFLLAGREVDRNPDDVLAPESLETSRLALQSSLDHLKQVLKERASSTVLGSRDAVHVEASIMKLVEDTINGSGAAADEDDECSAISIEESTPAATGAALVELGRDAASVLSQLLFASTQADLSAASHTALAISRRLASASSVTRRLTHNPEVIRSVSSTCQSFLSSLVEMLKVSRQAVASGKTLGSSASGDVSKVQEEASIASSTTLQAYFSAIRSLPGASGASSADLTDPSSSVTNELQACVEEMSRAVATIKGMIEEQNQNATRDLSVGAQNGVDVGTIPEADASTFEAVAALAEATAHLVLSASRIQTDRDCQMTASSSLAKKYRNDPTWAHGLISAGRSVVASIQNLVVACRDFMSDRAGREVLVASVQAVGSSTAQLVVASRIGSNATSQLQTDLTSASADVKRCTTALIQVTQEAAQREDEQTLSAKFSGYGFTGVVKAKFDQQVKILQLEAQVERERQRLAMMKRSEYQDDDS